EVFVAASDQRDALGGAAGFADLVDAEADELGLLGDEHDLAVFLDGERGDDLAGLFGRFHIDDADAAASCEAIARDDGLLAKTFFRNGKDLFGSLLRDAADRDYVIAFTQI